MSLRPCPPLVAALTSTLVPAIFAGACGPAGAGVEREPVSLGSSHAPGEPAAAVRLAGAEGTSAEGERALAFTFFAGTLEEALAAAKGSGKRVLVDVGAYWCHPCHELEEEVFSLPKVGEVVADGFVALRLDAEKDQGPELVERYRVQAYPTLLVLDGDGLELGRLVEVADAATLISGLGEIAERGDPLAGLEARAAAQENPHAGHLEARYRLALAYALRARREEAEVAYQAVLAGDPENRQGLAAKALYDRATLLIATVDDDGEAAIAAFRDLQERFPSSPEARRSRRAMGRELHRRGRSDEAIESLEAMIAAAPDDVTLRASYGWFSLRQQCRPAAGLRAVEGGLEKDPENAELHHLRAELAHLLGDDSTALAALRKAAEIEPKTALYRHRLRDLLSPGGGSSGGA